MFHPARDMVLGWVRHGKLPKTALVPALKTAGVFPSLKDWHRFLYHLCLWLGLALCLAGVIFFFAHNWNHLSRFEKFALAQGILGAGLLGALAFKTDSRPWQASLAIVIIGTGALLALIGQTYQTGADPWQLFFRWALLALPVALVGRFQPLWVIWAVVYNVFLLTWTNAQNIEEPLYAILLTANIGPLVLWEAARRFLKGDWMQPRWAVRVLIFYILVIATISGLLGIFDSPGRGASQWGLAWGLGPALVTLGVMGAGYRFILRDVFALAMTALSAIIIGVSALNEYILDALPDALQFLAIAGIVIGLSALAAMWLMREIGDGADHD